MKKERKGQHFIKKPYYEGGMSALKVFIKQQLSYPKLAKAKKVEGAVHIRYTINYKGKVINTKIISGIGFGCDEEAIRLVKLLEFNVPKNRNLKAVFHKNLQIHFRLPTEKEVKTNPLPPALNINYYYTTTPAEQSNKEIKKSSYTIIIKE